MLVLSSGVVGSLAGWHSMAVGWLLLDHELMLETGSQPSMFASLLLLVHGFGGPSILELSIPPQQPDLGEWLEYSMDCDQLAMAALVLD